MSDGLERLGAALTDRYRLERELGQGGMATVYLAQDLRHDRRVALKVLRPELAAVIGAERFLAEIKTTANLQHPHILPLFDSGRVDGSVFYVMPYVPGESLRDRLVREKQLPIDEAVRIAREVADALAAAHAAGIIHRDIKPENILLQGDHALVADFGIALAAIRADGTGRMTETGMSLGTPHYMSPEQALGERQLDGRTDIYALGCVLYEMLAGEPPFTGPSAQAILARVMNERPRSLHSQRSTVSPGLDFTVLRALEKLPADRFASAQSFKDALLAPADSGRAVEVPAKRGTLALLGLGIFAAGIGVGWRFLGSSSRDVTRAEPRRTTIILPESAPLVSAGIPWLQSRSLALSKDSRSLVYLAGGSSPHLRLVRLDTGTEVDLRGTDSAVAPVFSPDGAQIAFVRPNGDLLRISLTDGTTTPVTTVSDFDWPTMVLSWETAGEIHGAYYPICIFSVVAGGGPKTTPGSERCVVTNISQVPESEWFLFEEGGVIKLVSGRSGEKRPLSGPKVGAGVGGVSPFFIPPGYLGLLRGGTVFAAPFDRASLSISADPRPVLVGVRQEAGSGQAQLTLAGDGTLIWAAGQDRTAGQLAWIDTTGPQADSLTLPPAYLGGLLLSRDGKRVAVQRSERGERWSLIVADLERQVIEPVPGAGNLVPLAWIRGDSALLVASVIGNERRLITFDQGRPVVDSTDVRFDGESPDGRFRCRQRGATVLFRMGPPADSVVLGAAEERFPECRFSPDSRWVAWQNGIDVMAAPTDARGADAVIRLPGAGQEPRFLVDGVTIATRLTQSVLLHRIPGRGETIAPPREFPVPMLLSTQGPSWDLAPNGRFVAVLARPPTPVSRLEVMTHFPEYVRAKLAEGTPR